MDDNIFEGYDEVRIEDNDFEGDYSFSGNIMNRNKRKDEGTTDWGIILKISLIVSIMSGITTVITFLKK